MREWTPFTFYAPFVMDGSEAALPSDTSRYSLPKITLLRCFQEYWNSGVTRELGGKPHGSGAGSHTLMHRIDAQGSWKVDGALGTGVIVLTRQKISEGTHSDVASHISTHKLGTCSFRLSDELIKNPGVSGVGGWLEWTVITIEYYKTAQRRTVFLFRPFYILFLNPSLPSHYDVNVANRVVALAFAPWEYCFEGLSRCVRVRGMSPVARSGFT